MADQRSIAYFSMEIGLEDGIPTYSGGLGVLAGDTICSAADLGVPMVAVTLLYRKGYFRQRLDGGGQQTEEPVGWNPGDVLTEMPQRVQVTVHGRAVFIRAWRYNVRGVGGFAVPVFFLDADLPQNSEWDRTLTHSLYGGDDYYRLCQEVVLGIGGVRMLRALGYGALRRFHMNEGHSALLTLELLAEESERRGKPRITAEEIDAVRGMCVFTTHTPVPAGHDQFPLDMVYEVVGHHPGFFDRFSFQGRVNMTYLALNLSRYVNGVAKKHGEVSRLMFAGHQIDAITNGVHAGRWVSGPFEELYDRHIAGWREDNFMFRGAVGIPVEEIRSAHESAKGELIRHINEKSGMGMGEDVFTIGFARRATLYKRGNLLFHDIGRLKRIASDSGPIQVVYAGKAHPRDNGGKELIRRIFQAGDALRNEVKVAYLEDYGMHLGRLVTSGVDLWLNTPQPPQEASGTSGMKAALNGVPSLSVLDGWWIEGHIEGVTGWAVGEGTPRSAESGQWEGDAASVYDKLEKVIVPLYYGDRDGFAGVMRSAITLNGSFFNTQRMMQEYVLKAYL